MCGTVHIYVNKELSVRTESRASFCFCVWRLLWAFGWAPRSWFALLRDDCPYDRSMCVARGAAYLSIDRFAHPIVLVMVSGFTGISRVERARRVIGPVLGVVGGGLWSTEE